MADVERIQRFEERLKALPKEYKSASAEDLRRLVLRELVPGMRSICAGLVELDAEVEGGLVDGVRSSLGDLELTPEMQEAFQSFNPDQAMLALFDKLRDYLRRLIESGLLDNDIAFSTEAELHILAIGATLGDEDLDEMGTDFAALAASFEQTTGESISEAFAGDTEGDGDEFRDRPLTKAELAQLETIDAGDGLEVSVVDFSDEEEPEIIEQPAHVGRKRPGSRTAKPDDDEEEPVDGDDAE